MNKKIIWGIIVLVIIGGVYCLTKWSDKNTNEGDSAAQMQLLTVDWKTYTFRSGNMEVKYPADFDLYDDNSKNIQTFSFPKTYFSDSNIIGADIAIFSPGNNKPLEGQYVEINGMGWVRSDFQKEITPDIDGRKENYYSRQLSYVWCESGCLEIALQIVSTDKSGLDSEDAKNMTGIFEKMVSTFKYPTISNDSIIEKIATPTDDSQNAPFLVQKTKWGISFPLPTGWNMTNDIDSQVVLTQASTGDRITLDYTKSYSYTDIDAKRGQVTYTFNDVSGKWIALENTYTDGGMVSNEAKPVLMIQKIIPVFAGSSRWKTYIVPLSHTQFLKINITGSGQTTPLDEFIKTIIITG